MYMYIYTYTYTYIFIWYPLKPHASDMQKLRFVDSQIERFADVCRFADQIMQRVCVISKSAFLRRIADRRFADLWVDRSAVYQTEHSHVYVYIYIYVHTYIHIYPCRGKPGRPPCNCIYTHMHVHLYIFIFIFTYIYICTLTYDLASIIYNIYIYI